MGIARLDHNLSERLILQVFTTQNVLPYPLLIKWLKQPLVKEADVLSIKILDSKAPLILRSTKNAPFRESIFFVVLITLQ